MSKIVLCLSGGMDSTALATNFLDEGDDVIALMVHYGQKHSKELKQAALVIEHLQNRFGIRQGNDYRITPFPLDLGTISGVFGGSALTSEKDVPEGHYADSNMKQTIVPNRNMVLLSLAVAVAVQTGADAVAFGAHKGDHDVYPDCRKEFIDAMKLSVELATENRVSVLAPFHDFYKYEIAAFGSQINTPFNLTWSCYKGEEFHCGRCATCVERLEALHIAGVDDGLFYQDSEFWKKAVKK